MKLLFLIVVLIAFGCNTNRQNSRQEETGIIKNTCFEYPSVVDSLHIQDLYDSARWYVYTWHCDDKYLPKSDTSKSMTFGELPLRFDNLIFKHDTLEMNFNFIDKQEAILPSMSRIYKELVTGVGFDIKSRKKIYMLSPNGFSAIDKGSTTRYENPLQPEVLGYIKSNWSKLDSCFKELVDGKGIMK